MKQKLLNSLRLQLCTLVACLLCAFNGQAWGEEKTKTEGFETKTASTSYNGTVTISETESDCGIGWTIYYGTVSTSSKISGSNSAALRLYTSDNFGYLQTTTPIEGLKSVSFNAKAATSYGAKISIDISSSVDGENWTAIHTNVATSTSSTNESVNIPAGDKYFKIGISSKSTKPSKNNAQLTIDDIVFTYEESGSSAETVATPTFTPAAGAVTAGTEVTISSTTSDATIYYTTDGSTPSTTNGTQGSTVTINNDCTVKAIAVKEGAEDSDVATAEYTIMQAISGYNIDFENDLDSYVDWDFVNIGNSNTAIDAHGGSKYGANINDSGNAVTTASITTKAKIANPTTFTCYVSKTSSNSTVSTWYVEVSTDGSDWTEVATQSAVSMNKGDWTEVTANLGTHKNAYVRLRYNGTNAIRAVDDISIVEGGKMTATVNIGKTALNIGEATTVTTDGPAVTLSTSDAAIASVEGTTVTAVAAGTATITATWAENDEYEGGSQEFAVTVTDPNAPGSQNNPYTVAQALDASPSNGVFVKGTVSNITEFSTQYHNATYEITDGTKTMIVYRGKYLDNADFTSEDQIKIGDRVVVYGNISQYHNVNQFAQGNYIVSLVREKQDPTIVVADASVVYGSTYTIDTDVIEGGEITVTSGNTAVATVDGLVITPVAVGSAVITVATAANDQYNAGSETFTLTVTAPEGKTTAPTASEGEVFFYESFNNCEGAGGNDNIWSGSIANNDIVYDITGWETDNGKGANKCAKFGTGSLGGYLLTPTLGRAGDFTLTFKAAAWNGSKEGTTLSLSTDDTPGTLNAETVTLVKGQWSDYTVSITGATAETRIRFYTSAGNNRVFLDEVKIEAPATEVEDITVSLNTKGYATYCSQYPLDFTNATDYTAWAVTSVSSEGAVTFSQITGAVMGGVGVLLKGPEGATINLSSTDSNNVPDNQLIGTLAPTYIDEVGSVFGLSGDKFVKNNAVGAVKANKAYLPASVLGFMPIVGPDGPEGIKMLTFVFEGADGVKSVERISANEAVEIFNIAGQRVSTMQRGVNIVNGKKVLVK